ncbi:CPBP family intramembrane glutamic endopeptidase [Crocinitomix algicola]|uniref:CPBP family intramembrane glutamic endopeptidase n=1 Tax=Crocinitomix algicola TaxID=1740263 RepID=UPI0008304009|nr:CPBP family intramembrane glutamic endopeptidase [Crocinitomix algicola]
MPIRSFSPGAQVIFFIFIMIFMSLMGDLIFSLALSAVVDYDVLLNINWKDPRMLISRIFFSQVFYFLLSFLLFLKLSGQRYSDLIHTDRLKWRPILFTLIALILLYFSMPILSWINELIRPILPPGVLAYQAKNEALQELIVYHNNPVQLIFSIVVLGLVPAIFEELVFRGFLINKMLASGISEVGAILMSSTIFAMSHMQPLNVLVMFAAGCLLAFIYLRFKNIKYNIILHFLFNGVQLFIAYSIANGYFELGF